MRFSMANTFNDDIIEIIPIDITRTKNTYQLYMDTKNLDNPIHITVGDTEATNIFLNMNTNIFEFDRLDTHGLMIKSLEVYDVKIVGIIITDQDSDKWLTQIELINMNTQESTFIDTRPSDAICIALKLNLPINIYQTLLNKKNINYTAEPNILNEYYKNDNLNLLTIEQLLNLIDKYVLREDYETAKKIQDLINTKQKRKT